MPTQKALYIPAKHAPMVVGDVPLYEPGLNEVLVKIVSTALNPIDWKVHRDPVHIVYAKSYPFIPGIDGAGIVEKVGAQVTNLEKGDKVVFQGFFENKHATFQQYTLVPPEFTAKIPDNISFDQAASLPIGLSTVLVPLFNHDPNSETANFTAFWEEGGTEKYSGKPAFIIGGASSVGQYAIQVAKLSGYSPIITTASLRNESLLKSLGATHVLDRSLPPSSIVDEIQKIAGGKPVEYVYDAISLADTEVLGYDALAPGGTLIIVLDDNRAVGAEFYKRLSEWLRTGVIVPNKVEVLPNGLAGIPDGLDRMEQNKVSATKLIAHPQETA